MHLEHYCYDDIVEVLIAPDPSRHYAVPVKYACPHLPNPSRTAPYLPVCCFCTVILCSMLDLMEANVQLGTLFLAYPTKLLALLDEAVRDIQVRDVVPASACECHCPERRRRRNS